MAKTKSKRNSLTQWAKTAKPRPPDRCFVCRDLAVAEAVAEFCAMKRAGETAIQWSQFIRDYLVDVLGWRYSPDAVLRHVRNHIRIE